LGVGLGGMIFNLKINMVIRYSALFGFAFLPWRFLRANLPDMISPEGCKEVANSAKRRVT
jgi:hypothetical protein